MNLDEMLLTEGVSDRKLYHYTNLEKLVKMIRYNTLKPATDESGVRGFKTVRASAPKQSDIRVVIDGRHFSDTVRGAEIKPVNTEYKEAKQQMKHYLGEGPYNDKKFNAFVKEITPFIKPYLAKKTPVKFMDFDIPREKANEFVKKYGFRQAGEMKSVAHKYYEAERERRETPGEESVGINRVKRARKIGGSLGFNPKYARVEFLKVPKGKDYLLWELKDLIEKNKEKFIDNKVLQDVIKAGEEAQTKEEDKLKAKNKAATLRSIERAKGK